MRLIFFLLLVLFLISTGKNTPMNIHPEEEDYLVTVQKMPVLIGGYELLKKKIKYPENARIKSVEGKVYILAYVDENGNCTDVKIVKGIGYGCDEESVRVVKISKFIPGENNDLKVKSKLTLAINFKLNY